VDYAAVAHQHPVLRDRHHIAEGRDPVL
jgi:hypothetical protein